MDTLLSVSHVFGKKIKEFSDASAQIGRRETYSDTKRSIY
jgi:hypothetical protein